MNTFQEQHTCKAAVLSIKAAGVGLTLTVGLLPLCHAKAVQAYTVQSATFHRDHLLVSIVRPDQTFPFAARLLRWLCLPNLHGRLARSSR